MENIGQHFQLGIWAVKPGNAQEFVEARQSSSEWLGQKLPNERGAVLLEDAKDPARYISFAPVSNPNEVKEIIDRAEFQQVWSRVMELCEDLNPTTMRIVGSVGL